MLTITERHVLCFFFFFFSSRRRHTRYWRDWSSDVCSSDLSSCGAPLDVRGEEHTLTLAPVDADAGGEEEVAVGLDDLPEGAGVLVVKRGPGAGSRFVLDSEEVSADRKSTRPELQSRQYLVCRLLLEKKKQMDIRTMVFI